MAEVIHNMGFSFRSAMVHRWLVPPSPAGSAQRPSLLLVSSMVVWFSNLLRFRCYVLEVCYKIVLRYTSAPSYRVFPYLG